MSAPHSIPSKVKKTPLLLVIAYIAAPAALLMFAGVSLLLYLRFSTVQPACSGEYTHNTPANFTADPFAPAFDTAPYWMPTYESVQIASESGITVSGWFVRADVPDAPAVIVVHGLGAGAPDCKRSPRALLIAGMLHRAGYQVLLIDLRQHGDSTVTHGRWAGNTREYRDVIAAWQWLIDERGIPPDRIGLAGYSGGTGAVMIAMGEEPRIAAAWLDSVYPDVPTAIGDLLERSGVPRFFTGGGLLVARLIGNDLTGRSPLDAAASIDGRAIFITHADADPFLLPHYADQVLAALGETGTDAQFWQVHADTHVRAMFTEPDEYERRLVNFFNAALNSPVRGE